jgi:hypothetical protein
LLDGHAFNGKLATWNWQAATKLTNRSGWHIQHSWLSDRWTQQRQPTCWRQNQWENGKTSSHGLSHSSWKSQGRHSKNLLDRSWESAHQEFRPRKLRRQTSVLVSNVHLVKRHDGLRRHRKKIKPFILEQKMKAVKKLLWLGKFWKNSTNLKSS